MTGRRMLRTSATGLLLALSPIAASAQNLVANGGFSAALDGWRESGDGAALPSPDDIDGDPASGSALLRNALPDAGTRTFPLEQCVVLAGPGTYLIGGSARVDAAQVGGRAQVTVVAYGNSDCTGSIRGGAGLFVPRASAWTTITFTYSVDIAQSFLLRLGVDKPGAGDMLEVQVDDVFVELTPLLFRNGFE
jgi:hypothetical protein